MFEGVSKHGFLNGTGRIVRLKKEQPEFYEVLISFVKEGP